MAVNNNKPLAFITGGSSGIGKALALKFGQEGYNLLLCADGRDNLIEAADELRAKTNANIEIVCADLTTKEGVHAAYDAAKSLGPVDVFCANAGMGTYGDFTTETDLDTEMKIIDLNTKAVVHLTKHIARDMVARKRGKILITASVVSFVPDAYQTVYAATKAFDYIFAEGLRQSLKDTGVTVTALLPGATDTNFFFRAGATNSKIYQDGPLADPNDVAKVAYDALMDEKDHVVHGMMNKMSVEMANFFPTPFVAALNEKQMQPKKGSQK